MSPDEQPVQPQDAETANEPNVDKGATIDDVSPEPPNEAKVLAEEEETPTPSTLHPSAAAGTTPEDDDIVSGREEHGEYFIGMWGDRPNFGCPYCYYSSSETGGNGEIELHVLTQIDSGNLKHMAALQLQGE